MSFFLAIKVYYSFSVISHVISWVFTILLAELFAFSLTVLFIATIKKIINIYTMFSKLQTYKKTIMSSRGSRSQVFRLKEDMKLNSFVVLGLVAVSFGLIGLIKKLDSLQMPEGLSDSVLQNVPIHVVIYSVSKLYTWYHKKQLDKAANTTSNLN